MNALEYYSKTRKFYIRFPLADSVPIDNRLALVAERFVLWMREAGYAETTIHNHERVVKCFLDSAASYVLEDVSSIDASHISNFFMEITGHRGIVSYELNFSEYFFAIYIGVGCPWKIRHFLFLLLYVATEGNVIEDAIKKYIREQSEGSRKEESEGVSF